MQAHSKITIRMKAGNKIEITAPSGVSVIAPLYDMWSVYDLDGVAHVFNWQQIMFMNIVQVPESADEPPAVPPL
jgi:hypothetical protein